MEDTRINFETAKLAKEKGCNLENCTCGGYPDCICSDKRISQSLLAKWLREEHNLHINISSLSMNCFSFMLEKLNDTGTTLCGGHLGKINYKTYEEAYEIGLQEALKLI